ncbi:hypothetical protein [Nocardia sp. NPDC057668]|uniref:hypothetical protein n=1 Tax=Nocardia sp. NPDC057668 TaxID=3346202 RepID=UPI003670401D
MSIADQSVLSLVVVLSQTNDRLVVWHVNVGRGMGLSRLSGAWVVDAGDGETVERLTGGHRRLWCDEVAGDAADVVDLAGTVAAVEAEVEAVDGVFTRHQETLAGKLIRPVWPEMVHPAAARQPLHDVDPEVRPVLAMAWGLAGLADAWAEFESLRVARPFLVEHGGRTPRALPVRVR